MVSKCANPNCSAPFLYLHQGKLFRLETDAQDPVADAAMKKFSRRTEFFWLCSECAARLTLGYEKGVGLVIVSLSETHGYAAAAS